MERETDREREREKRHRSSYKRATEKHEDVFDGRKNQSNGRYRRTEEESHRMSRRDEFSKRNPRSDSPLTIETLEKHEKRTARKETTDWDDQVAFKGSKSKKREPSPSRTYDSSEVTQTSLTTEGTATTGSSRFAKNPSLRRNSPARSSSHRRYRQDGEKDEKGRRKPRRTRSSERERQERSRSPGSSRSGSGSTRRSRSSSAREAKKINKEQAMLPIFADMKKK